LESVLAAANTVKMQLGETETTAIVLNQIIPTRVKNYYRYSGSLTVEPCDEVSQTINIIISLAQNKMYINI